MQSHRDNDSHDREGLCGENRKLIDDLCSGCCSTERYCTLKEILVRAPRDARTLIQIKCLEKFKYELSSAAGHDVGWQHAFETWNERGHAGRFARLYRAGVRVSDLYQAITAEPAKG